MRQELGYGELLGFSNELELADAAGGIPVLDIEVTVFVKAQSVRCGEDTECLFRCRNFEVCPLLFVAKVNSAKEKKERF